MPILHTQMRGEGQDKDGKKLILPPKVALSIRGPVLQVTLGLEESVAAQIVQQNKPIPQPIPGLALVDTGASVTCIDNKIAEQLGLPVVDKVKMASASHDATEQNVYPVLIDFTGFKIRVNAQRVMGASLGNQGLAVLVGRDLLQNFTLFYNGITGEITMSL